MAQPPYFIDFIGDAFSKFESNHQFLNACTCEFHVTIGTNMWKHKEVII